MGRGTAMTGLDWRGAAGIALVAIVVLAASCSSTKQGVDATPTLHARADAHIGKGWNGDSTQIESVTNHFAPNETVYAIIDVHRHSGTMNVKWLDAGGATVQEKTVMLMPEANVYSYRFTPPDAGFTPGEYKLEVWVEGEKLDTESFTVQ